MADEPAISNEAASLLAPGQIVAGRYRARNLLGAGGMGAVYEVEHLKTGRVLALKLLLPALAKKPAVVQRFLAEARAAAALRHKAIVEIIDMDVDGDMNFLVMEKLEGEELAARIVRGHPLSTAFVARVGADIADAMSAAHENQLKIIHRDLKPQNVFLARQGKEEVVKILDFGIAKLVEDDVLGQALTRTGDVYGTPLYMSPEQMRSSKDVDERTDIYAIGAILYQAVTGRTPFVAESYPDLVLKVGTETPEPIEALRPDAPPALRAIITKALARNRDDRHRTAAELRDALRAFVAGDFTDALGATIAAAPAPARSPKQAASTVTIGGKTPTVPGAGRGKLIAAVIALTVAGGAFLALRASPPPPKPLAGPTAPKRPADEPGQKVLAPPPPPPVQEPTTLEPTTTKPAATVTPPTTTSSPPAEGPGRKHHKRPPPLPDAFKPPPLPDAFH